MNGNLTRHKEKSFLEIFSSYLSTSFREFIYKTPFYKQRLKGKHPLKLIRSPEDPFIGNPAIGAGVIEDKVCFSGHLIEKAEDQIWTKVNSSPALFLKEMHGFSWLPHLATLADKKRATKRAEGLTRLWLDKNYKWSLPSWRPDLIGQRIINWTFHAPLILSSSDMVYRSRVLNSLARQSRHLYNASNTAPSGLPRIEALIGLSISGVLVPDGEKRLQKGLTLLKVELENFILADGGCVTRNPRDCLTVLKFIIYLKSCLIDDDKDCPEWLQNTADKIVPFLKCLQHIDKSFASFEGAFPNDAQDIKTIFQLSNAKGKAIENASLTGFIRTKAKNSLLIMDVGTPPNNSFSSNSHAGCLSFEFSDDKDRIVTNMGGTVLGFGGDDANLNHYSRHTGAHSTLCFRGEDIIPVSTNGFLKKEVFSTQFQKKTNDDGIWIDATHNGYEKRFGAVHSRSLFLDNDGNDLRGEDKLTIHPRKIFGFLGRGDEDNIGLHFILHPKVSASPTQDGKAIILRLAHGHGWLFRAKGGEVRLEDAIHCEKAGNSIKTLRIVVETTAPKTNSAKINWQFKKLEKNTL